MKKEPISPIGGNSPEKLLPVGVAKLFAGDKLSDDEKYEVWLVAKELYTGDGSSPFEWFVEDVARAFIEWARPEIDAAGSRDK